MDTPRLVTVQYCHAMVPVPAGRTHADVVLCLAVPTTDPLSDWPVRPENEHSARYLITARWHWQGHDNDKCPPMAVQRVLPVSLVIEDVTARWQREFSAIRIQRRWRFHALLRALSAVQ